MILILTLGNSDTGIKNIHYHLCFSLPLCNGDILIIPCFAFLLASFQKEREGKRERERERERDLAFRIVLTIAWNYLSFFQVLYITI
jgi:hypothetical protein